MSKIICDVCGTSYPETATQCPICGCVRPADAHGVAGDTNENAKSGYTYVKGGRFSKANVKKRTGAAQTVARETAEAPEKQKDGRGLVITAVLLLLAIIAVVIYIAVRFLMPPEILNNPDSTSTNTTADTAEVLCEDLFLDVKKIVLAELDESRMLYASAWPTNTTEEIFFESSDESVVTVSQSGKVTAVGPGTAWITVTCGTVSVTCDVECTFELETTDDTQETTEETQDTTVDTNTEFILNRKDITFSRKGETWVIYDGTVPLSSITWTSDNEAVCTISNGKVEAVGYGETKVHAEYNGQKVSCIIRCSFKADSAGGTGGNVSEDGGGVSEDGGSASNGQTKTVAANYLTVRNGAGTSCDALGTLTKGDKVEVIETKSVSGKSWGKISFGSTYGWICLDYVE